jgi:hypothetical protein
MKSKLELVLQIKTKLLHSLRKYGYETVIKEMDKKK